MSSTSNQRAEIIIIYRGGGSGSGGGCGGKADADAAATVDRGSCCHYNNSNFNNVNSKLAIDGGGGISGGSGGR